MALVYFYNFNFGNIFVYASIRLYCQIIAETISVICG